MSALGTRMDAIANSLAAAYPARKVRRSFVDFSQLKRADLLAGVYTLVSAGEHGFTNVPGYMARDGAQNVKLIGQIESPEQKDKSLAGQAIEEAEFTLIEEVKAWLGTLQPDLCVLALTEWAQSQQLEEPYGWIACNLEYRP